MLYKILHKHDVQLIHLSHFNVERRTLKNTGTSLWLSWKSRKMS